MKVRKDDGTLFGSARQCSGGKARQSSGKRVSSSVLIYGGDIGAGSTRYV